MTTITKVSTRDARYPLKPGEGADALHTDPIYAYAVTHLHTDSQIDGVGIALTLGDGNELVCKAIEAYAESLVNCDIETLMADFGATFKQLTNHPRYRWLGPYKGVIHLAIASIVNACFDLWAKSRGLPLWALLLELTPEQIVSLLDLSYLEDVLTANDALALLNAHGQDRDTRRAIISQGYPGYDTSVGWFQYSDEQVRENIKQAMGRGFSAMKLKVGSDDPARDIRRAKMVREIAGDDATIMLDCNQKWTLPEAIENCRELGAMSPYWIEEPTHPDDVNAHRTLAQSISPVKIALGEHVPNAVLFKNYFQAAALGFCQVDCTRVGGVAEFITVSLLARKYGIPVVPHVGDMGQIHQHLVIFNHIALNHEVVFLEHIPHLAEHFVHPAVVEDGVYRTPQEPGAATDLRDPV